MMKWKKTLAMCLALSLCVSSFGIAAMAETVNNPDGTTTTTTTTTDTVSGPGNMTVTVKIESETTGTTTDGVAVEGKETYVETTVQDQNGNTISMDWVRDGEEIRKWTEEDSGDAAGQPEVTVPLVPGAETQKSSDPVTTTSGNTTTTMTDRKVTAETSEVVITESKLPVSELQGIIPVMDSNREDIRYDDWDWKTLDDLSVSGTAPEGFEFQVVEEGEGADQFISRLYVEYEKDENGDNKLDADGNPIIKNIYKFKGGNLQVLTVDGVPATNFDKPFDQPSGLRPYQGILMDKDGNAVTVYCAEFGVGTDDKYWYTVANIEDSDYYATEDAENHIRSIATNGYWGTESGTGSLAQIKENMKSDLDDAQITIGKDAEGNDITKSLHELIDELTEGEALYVTQAAIWSYSNGSVAVRDGKDGFTVGDIGYAATPSGNYNLTAFDPSSDARLRAMYHWLLNLKGKDASDVVINAENFVDDFTLTIGDKVGEKAAKDENGSEIKDTDGNAVMNGVYEAKLNFTLAFTPCTDDEKGDDLLVHIQYRDFDGELQTVVRRLAGVNGEGENWSTITPVKGVYTIEGLKLSENEDLEFDLRLEGTQYLEQGVYIFTSEIGGTVEDYIEDTDGDGYLDKQVVDHSQQLIGIAEGTREVNISRKVVISFDVDETDVYQSKRTWHDEDPWNVPFEPFNPPGEEIPDNDPPLSDGEEILDEDVPLAGLPNTGDASHSSLCSVIAAGVAMLVLICCFGKSRKSEN